MKTEKPKNVCKNYCVYKHTNKENGKSYIGITCKKNPMDRWQNGNGYKTQVKFYRAIEAYGWDKFTHEILHVKLTKEEASKKEIKLIKKFDTVNNGYNVLKGGIGEKPKKTSNVAPLESRRKMYKEESFHSYMMHYGCEPTDGELEDYMQCRVSFKEWNMLREYRNATIGYGYSEFYYCEEVTEKEMREEFDFDENGFIIKNSKYHKNRAPKYS